MGKTYTEAQARATAKYIANQDEIKIRVPKGKKDEWKRIAEERGFQSLNQYIIYCIEKGS